MWLLYNGILEHTWRNYNIQGNSSTTGTRNLKQQDVYLNNQYLKTHLEHVYITSTEIIKKGKLEIPLFGLLQKWLKMNTYKLYLLQNQSDQDRIACHDFCTEMLEHCENEDGFIGHLIFSDAFAESHSTKVPEFLNKMCIMSVNILNCLLF